MTLTPEQLAKLREEFEQYFRKRPAFMDNFIDKDLNGNYQRNWVQDYFNVWQASRESLVVELPKRGKGFYNDDMVDIDDVIESLQSAGINYREKE